MRLDCYSLLKMDAGGGGNIAALQTCTMLGHGESWRGAGPRRFSEKITGGVVYRERESQKGIFKKGGDHSGRSQVAGWS